MTYTISVVISGEREPNALIRTFWGVMMGMTAIVLISIGSGGVTALQSFIVITAVPVSFIMLPALWNGPQIAKQMAKDQDLYRPNSLIIAKPIVPTAVESNVVAGSLEPKAIIKEKQS